MNYMNTNHCVAYDTSANKDILAMAFVNVQQLNSVYDIETGFTTTFIPDVIVRAEHTSQEFGLQSVLSSAILGFGGTVTLKYAVMAAAKKGSAGLLKLGTKSIVKTAVDKIAAEGVQTVLGSFLKGFADAAKTAPKLGGLLTNPVALSSTLIGGASVFMLVQCVKESFTRWCRNIQALTVFPITKHGRLLIAGMAGHRGSVYGYQYSGKDKNNSIQGMVMNFLSSEYNTGCIDEVFNFILCDENYEKVKNKWINNLGLENSNDIINGDGAGDSRNVEAFYQYLSNSISKEYTARAAYLAAMKTRPRIQTFNTSINRDGKAQPRSSETYLKYQIGGVHDLSNPDDDPARKAVAANELSTNERIKALLPLEDDPDIKLALNSDAHPVIKKFIFLHSSSPLVFNLQMENEDTIIRYIAEPKGNYTIYDLPMLQEDAVMLIKLIINSENLKGREVTFMSGTRVNSTSSWKSTGFWFSLSCDDVDALEKVSSDLRKESSWNTSFTKTKSCFAYKRTGDTIQYTVYAPIEQDKNTIEIGDDEKDE